MQRKGHKTGLKGSFTVEAAFLCPVIVVLCALVLHAAIDMYGDVEKTADDLKTLQNLNTFKVFFYVGDKDENRVS